MRKKKSSRVSIGDIAAAAGLSKSATSYALRGQPDVSQATRDRVLQIAQHLGYVPDARLGLLMKITRGAKTKDLLPIAWLNTNREREAWHQYKFLSPYFEGMQERSEQMGYRVDEIWTHQPGMTMRRISQILYQRGIEGVVVTPPAAHIRLDWNKLAGVALGAELLGPRLNRVNADATFNLHLTLKILKRFGYQRIGICLSEAVDRCSNHMISAVASHLLVTEPRSKAVPALFYKYDDGNEITRKKQIQAWVRKYKPDVIVGQDNHLVKWVEELGHCVPQTIGIAHISLDDDVLDWAGIYSNKKEIGRATAELVISLMQNRRFGMPAIPFNALIPGTWRPGRTLLIPKPKKS